MESEEDSGLRIESYIDSGYDNGYKAGQRDALETLRDRLSGDSAAYEYWEDRIDEMIAALEPLKGDENESN